MATAATLGDRVWITMQSATKIRDPTASKESCVTASSTSISFRSPFSQQTRVSFVDALSNVGKTYSLAHFLNMSRSVMLKKISDAETFDCGWKILK